MPFTQDQLNAINDSIAQGVLEVKYADKTITFRSLSEMIRTKDMIEASLGSGRSTRRYAVHNKDLGLKRGISEE